MRSGNNIHVQQHKTNMINEEWNKSQNEAPFVTFYNMHAITIVLPNGKCVNRSLLQSYELGGKQPFISDVSRLLRHAIETGRGPILYSKKKAWDPTGREKEVHNMEFHIVIIRLLQ